MADAPSDLKSHHAPEFKQGQGPDALPQGDATQLNAEATTAREMSAQTPPEPAQQAGPPGSPPTQAGFTPPEASLPPPDRGTSDITRFFAAPTQNPSEVVNAPMPTLPAGYEAWLPVLGQAASDPNAPWWVKGAYQRITEAARLQEALRPGAYRASS